MLFEHRAPSTEHRARAQCATIVQVKVENPPGKRPPIGISLLTLFPLIVVFSVPSFGEDTPFDPIVFELRKSTGVDFVIEPSRTENRYQPEAFISGVALFDYNNDGFLDIYAVSGATMPGLKKTKKVHYNRLYKGNGDFTFKDVTDQAGVRGRGYTHGVVAADYDDDGDQDLFVAGLRENILYQNNGDGTFADVTLAAGLSRPDPEYGTLWAVAAAFVDYDRDGRLDLFVSNYCVWDPETERVCGSAGSRDYCHPKYYHGLPNSLFHNDGNGTFSDVSVVSGIRQHVGKGMGIGAADFDDDGWIDLYVGNDTVPAFHFRNLGNGTFEEIAFESGNAFTFEGAAVASMGVDARDVNNDGLTDIFVAAMFNEQMPLFLNLGGNLFDEISGPTGLAAMTRDRTGWSNGIYDFNNDGWKDLFAASGDVMDPEGIYGGRVPQTNTLLANLKTGKFADAIPSAGKEFGESKAVHRGAAFGDIDNDGRVDVVVTALSGPTEIWRNVSPLPKHWLLISTVGSQSNRDGIGTKIRVNTTSGAQYNHVNTAVGYGCASDKRVHFGLGEEKLIDEVQITWPSGVVQTLNQVEADQILVVHEPVE